MEPKMRSGRARHLARRLPDLGLVAALSLPILLVAALLMGLALAARPASAEAKACEGASLAESLAAAKPDAYARARAEAAATENGSGLLWKVEKPGVETSFLFGTMHVTDPRVTRMPDAARGHLDAARTVVIETVDILDPAKAQAAMLSRPELTMFTDDRSLTSLLSEDDLKLVKDELDRRGIPLLLVSKMKPWMIAGLVATPPCELARKQEGIDFLDMKIAATATETGKELLGLETIGEQLAAMDSLPIEFHVRGLVETIRLGDLMPDIMATMTDLYLKEEVAMIMPVIRAASPDGLDDSAEDYAEFEEKIIRVRNHVMATRAAPILDKGAAFIAVGAMHLPGDEGVIALLRKAGYTVTREG